MMNNIHKKIEELIEQYLDDSITKDEKSGLKEHIINCSDCQTKFNDSVLVHEELALYLKGEGPNEFFLHDLIEKVNERLNSSRFFNYITDIFSLTLLKPIAIAGCLVLLVFIGQASLNELAIGHAAPESAVVRENNLRSRAQAESKNEGPLYRQDVEDKQAANSDKPFKGQRANDTIGSVAGQRYGGVSGGRARTEAGGFTGEADNALKLGEKSPSEEIALEKSIKKAESLESSETLDMKQNNSLSDLKRVRGMETEARGDLNELREEEKTEQEPAASISRKIIKTGYMDVEVESFEDSSKEIKAVAETYGGYVSDLRTITKQNGKIQATITVKVPAELFEDLVEKVKKMGKLENIRITSQDVTKYYTDLQSRLKNHGVMEERLLELMKKRDSKLKDLLEVEKQLGKVRGEIEKIQGEIKYYDSVTSLSTLHITIKEKGIEDPAVIIQTTYGYLTTRVDNVVESFNKLNKYFEEKKIDIKVANLQEQSNKESTNAIYQVMTDADKVESFIKDIENMEITIETQRIQKSRSNNNVSPEDSVKPEVKKEKAIIDMYLYHFSEKEIGQGQINLRTQDVPALYTSLKDKLASDFAAEIIYNNLNEGQHGQKTGHITFKIASDRTDSVSQYIKSLGEITHININMYPPQDEAAKVVKEIVTMNIYINPPQGHINLVQNGNFDIKAKDPSLTLEQIKSIVEKNGSKVLTTNFNSGEENSSIHMQIQSPADKFHTLIAELKNTGETKHNVSEDRQQVGTDPTSSLSPITIEQPAITTITIVEKDRFIAPDEGIFATFKKTLKNSFTGLLNSLRYLITGVAVVLPFAIAFLLLYILVIKKMLRKKGT